MNKLTIQSGANGHNTYAIPGSTHIDWYVSTGSAYTFTVPAGAHFVLFSATGDFYARWDGSAAAIPGATSTAGTGSGLNPRVRSVKAGDTFSLIAASGVVVSLEYYE